MIVHEAPAMWQVVRQTDHADLAAAFVQAWGNAEFAPPRPLESVLVAARRHDDGWAVWERSPRVAEDGQRPLSFLEVAPSSHVAFYEAAIVDITGEDPYAGLLVAMHGAGIYRERYGAHPGLRSRQVDEFHHEIEAFVAKMEASYADRIARLGIDEGERWANYRLLQVVDRLSLYFSGAVRTTMGEPYVIPFAPRDYESNVVELVIHPTSEFEPLTPTRVRIEPFPFAERPARFTLRRYLLDKREGGGAESLRSLLASREPETIELLAE
ncbi:MAG: hypothetical protein QOE69_3042 [Thermoleophilaceae bacterium]|jgi:hypothetical protein|nr:hypothetical protein [Thermoleophilaceae bacterium]